jgi:5-formyltetrahydrofolate cyclo-ligase
MANATLLNAAVQHPELDLLRREIRHARRALTPKARAHCSHKIIANLSSCHLLWSAQNIACFWPNDGEVDLTDLFEELWHRGKQVLLPVIDGQALWFAPYEPGTRLVSNQFGIPEPALKRQQACPKLAIDLVLMPLVAFDSHGHRLGMGGGFYDRTFAYLRHRKRLLRPRLIGAAFTFQQREQLPANAWDIPLNGVVTEDGYTGF